MGSRRKVGGEILIGRVTIVCRGGGNIAITALVSQQEGIGYLVADRAPLNLFVHLSV